MANDEKSNVILSCRYCHGQFSELVERCPWCGKQIAFHCANCGELTDDSTPLCVHCGQPHSPFAELAASAAAARRPGSSEPSVASPPSNAGSATPTPPEQVRAEHGPGASPSAVVPIGAPSEAPSLVKAARADAQPIVVVQQPSAPAKPPEPPMAIVATWRELRGPWRVFAMSEWIMRDRASFFEEIRARHELGPKLRSMVVSAIIYLALYGIVMGVSNSLGQAISSMIKLPVLFLVTLFICLPTLYFFNLLYGSQLTFAQTAALMMAAVTVTGALALAFASITLFFWLTVPDYGFFVLLNVGVLGITAWWGLSFLRQGMRHVQRGAPQARMGRILAVWIAIYAFVGTQMGWALRPFFGAPGAPFEIVRRMQGTFYTGVFNIIRGLLGF